MPDFSKIWATNSPLPAYAFSDADYLTGWDFVGAAPPTKNQFDAWFKATDEKLKYLYDQLQNTASKLYPVGSVYISFSAADPSTLFGGTWQRLKDTFLLANGDAYAADTTGGSPTKTISVNNMPAHNHSVSSSGNHTHPTTTTSANGSHSHAKGNMSIKGTAVLAAMGGSSTMIQGTSGAFSKSSEFVSSYDQAEPLSDNKYSQRLSFDTSNEGAWTGSTSTASNHTHTVSIASSGSHTHTTNNTGGSQPLNILPPYTTVYMWRRTA